MLSVYVTDFLLRARDQGFSVSSVALEKAEQRLLRYLQDRNAIQPYYSAVLNAERFSIQSYAGLVLAGQKQAPLGALRQLYQRRQDAGSGLPLIQLALALEKMGDQKRVETPAAAIAAGADHIVVGRPIWQAADPRAAAQAILSEIG